MDELGFGEDKALIDYILKHLSKENKEGVTADKIDNVLDCMIDFYSSKGYFEDDQNDDESIEIDEDEMFDFIKEELSRVSIQLTDEQLDEILALEYEYNQEEGVYD